MIGIFELDAAINDSGHDRTGGVTFAFLAAGIDLAVVQYHATRYAEVASDAGKPYRRAAAGGFMLGFELGVRAARLEQREPA